MSIIPILRTLISSFKDNNQILNSAFSLPERIYFANYIGAFENLPLAAYYMNSMIISGASIVLSLIVFSMSSYVFARFDFKHKEKLYILLSLSLFVPVTLIIFPVFRLINDIGLYDTKRGLTLVYTALSMPVVIYIIVTFLPFQRS